MVKILHAAKLGVNSGRELFPAQRGAVQRLDDRQLLPRIKYLDIRLQWFGDCKFRNGLH
ncbi:hypothetical protein SDC9_95386 [bioreactor metagenome]|uniref:Uncharacterized protein n=1 Tax=bioreactor metagenome TaxID=1076179 RepID=A0A645A658_9ZZZZ